MMTSRPYSVCRFILFSFTASFFSHLQLHFVLYLLLKFFDNLFCICNFLFYICSFIFFKHFPHHFFWTFATSRPNSVCRFILFTFGASFCFIFAAQFFLTFFSAFATSFFYILFLIFLTFATSMCVNSSV